MKGLNSRAEYLEPKKVSNFYGPKILGQLPVPFVPFLFQFFLVFLFPFELLVLYQVFFEAPSLLLLFLLEFFLVLQPLGCLDLRQSKVTVLRVLRTVILEHLMGREQSLDLPRSSPWRPVQIWILFCSEQLLKFPDQIPFRPKSPETLPNQTYSFESQAVRQSKSDSKMG